MKDGNFEMVNIEIPAWIEVDVRALIRRKHDNLDAPWLPITDRAKRFYYRYPTFLLFLAFAALWLLFN
jgi:hypothetical protein